MEKPPSYEEAVALYMVNASTNAESTPSLNDPLSNPDISTSLATSPVELSSTGKQDPKASGSLSLPNFSNNCVEASELDTAPLNVCLIFESSSIK